MSKLLFDSEPLVINRELAVATSLNEAIVLQQVHYWLEMNKQVGKHLHNGRYWTFNTYKRWREQFPFWSVDTIRRTIKSLEERGLLISDTFNRLAIDRTKWYTIDYERLNELVSEQEQGNKSPAYVRKVQNAQMHEGNLHRPLPETNVPETNKNDVRNTAVVNLNHAPAESPSVKPVRCPVETVRRGNNETPSTNPVETVRDVLTRNGIRIDAFLEGQIRKGARAWLERFGERQLERYARYCAATLDKPERSIAKCLNEAWTLPEAFAEREERRPTISKRRLEELRDKLPELRHEKERARARAYFASLTPDEQEQLRTEARPRIERAIEAHECTLPEDNPCRNRLLRIMRGVYEESELLEHIIDTHQSDGFDGFDYHREAKLICPECGAEHLWIAECGDRANCTTIGCRGVAIPMTSENVEAILNAHDTQQNVIGVA
jgi:hypothetical protein